MTRPNDKSKRLAACDMTTLMMTRDDRPDTWNDAQMGDIARALSFIEIAVDHLDDMVEETTLSDEQWSFCQAHLHNLRGALEEADSELLSDEF